MTNLSLRHTPCLPSGLVSSDEAETIATSSLAGQREKLVNVGHRGEG